MIREEKIRKSNERAPETEAPRPLRSPGVERRAPREVPVRPLEILQKKSYQFDQNTGFHGGPSARRKGYRLALWSFLAALIDTLILISLSCLFMIAFTLIVQTSLGGFMSGLFHNHHQGLLFLEIFAVAGWSYLIAVRALMGSTLGEWACDLRLGQPQERLRSGYVLRVALRSTLILLTGMVTLPLLSLIFGRDLPGMISGLRLFSLK